MKAGTERDSRLPRELPALVSYMSGVWRVPKARLKALMRVISEGIYLDMEDYGTYMGVLKYDITDMTPEEAKDIIEEESKA